MRLPSPFKSLFDPLFDSTTLGFSQVTVGYKAIGACTIVYNTDLQRGRAMMSMFRDVTLEIYACFQSLLPLYYLWYNIVNMAFKTFIKCLEVTNVFSHVYI